jgi:hypothetical protein
MRDNNALHLTAGPAGECERSAHRLSQVVQDRRWREDRRGGQPAHGGGGMTITCAAITVVLLLCADQVIE